MSSILLYFQLLEKAGIKEGKEEILFSTLAEYVDSKLDDIKEGRMSHCHGLSKQGYPVNGTYVEIVALEPFTFLTRHLGISGTEEEKLLISLTPKFNRYMIKRLPKEKNFVGRENEAPIGVPVIVREGGPREVKMPSYGMLLKLYTRN